MAFYGLLVATQTAILNIYKKPKPEGLGWFWAKEKPQARRLGVYLWASR